MMNKPEYTEFLNILHCALRDSEVPDQLVHRTEVIHLAHSHHVFPMVTEVLWNCPGISDNYKNALKKEAAREVLHQAESTVSFLQLYREFTGQDLHPIIMKGIILRDIFPHPVQRPSVDEDLLIRRQDYPKYQEILTKMGYVPVDPDTISTGEVSYTSPDKKVYLELHFTPFPENSKAYGDCNRLFKAAFNRSIEMVVYGVRVHTLCPSDHLLYLICHAYKHFLHSGVGIRQIMDITVYSEVFCGEIDWERTFKACQSLKIIDFTAAIYQIGANYLGGKVPPVFERVNVSEESLLLDVLSGGLYGTDDINRVHSSTMTLGAVESSREGKNKKGLARTLFPPKSSLVSRFGYLKKHGWLLPAAWVHRVLRYGRQRISKGSELRASETLKIGQDRIRLLKEYHII